MLLDDRIRELTQSSSPYLHIHTSWLAAGEGFWRLETDFCKAGCGCNSGSCGIDAIELQIRTKKKKTVSFVKFSQNGHRHYDFITRQERRGLDLWDGINTTAISNHKVTALQQHRTITKLKALVYFAKLCCPLKKDKSVCLKLMQVSQNTLLHCI